jgi:hypothetical protein
MCPSRPAAPRYYTSCRKCRTPLPTHDRHYTTCTGCRPRKGCHGCGAPLARRLLVNNLCASCVAQPLLPLFDQEVTG